MYDSGSDELKRKKSAFTLDLSDRGRKAAFRTFDLDPREGLLTSPDVGLLKLATPELERFLLQHNTAAVLTPTQIVVPKPVTEEQEAYARGFVDALLNLQRGRSPLVHSAGGLVRVDGDRLGSPSFVALTPIQFRPDSLISRPEIPVGAELPVSLATVPVMIPTTTMTIPVPNHQSSAFNYKPNHASARDSPTAAIQNTSKESSQTVPVVDLMHAISPIDMSNQERIKLERRREKNRCAAQKCRTRKIERIQRLEERIAELKGNNAQLARTANEQKEHVASLKQQIVEHVNSGCQIMTMHNIM